MLAECRGSLELTNEDRATNNGCDTATEGAVENDGKRFIDDDVGQEQGDENPVLSLVEELENSFGVLVL